MNAAARAVVGVLVGGFAALITLAGVIRLGIGRHGAPWWRPFRNELTRAHVENLVTLAVGILGMLVGAWLVVSAIRAAISSRRADTSDPP